MNNNVIYLDNQSTTPIDPRVLKEMNPFLTNFYGNPASSNHLYGWQANEAITIAREKVSKLINTIPDNIIFTSGATESINLALKGLYKNVLKVGDHIITTNIEHKAVIDVLDYLSQIGIEITYLPVNNKGLINLDDIVKSIKNKTKICTIIHGNNEIGTIQNIKKIGELCKKNNILFHVDAAQTLGKQIIDVNEMNIDLLSVSGHKLYAPKGVGALFIDKMNNEIKLTPLIHGGGQEYGLRCGTLSVHNIVGFGEACSIALENVIDDQAKILKLRNKLYDELKKIFPDIIINGSLSQRLDGNLNITIPNYNAQEIISEMTNLAFSTGSACMSENPEPSHVLTAIGLNEKEINETIRIGIGRLNTDNDINRTINYFKELKNGKN